MESVIAVVFVEILARQQHFYIVRRGKQQGTAEGIVCRSKFRIVLEGTQPVLDDLLDQTR